MKKIILILLSILITHDVSSQWSNRTFRPYYDDYDRVIAASVGHPESATIWMVDDIQIYEERAFLMDLKTQEGQNGVGIFINPVTNSGLFNYEAAISVCPIGWRLPRIGEWDTLIGTLTTEQINFMFFKRRGFYGYSVTMKDSVPHKAVQQLSGGFWWTSDKSKNRFIGKEFTEQSVWRDGYLESGDFAAVRCVKNDD
jgi:uncharacterized protein (TIGR02145 family)